MLTTSSVRLAVLEREFDAVSHQPKIALIGAGPMAVAYWNALTHRGITPHVFGRGEASAAAFEEKTGTRPSTGDLGDQLERAQTSFDAAIVAVNVDALDAVSRQLLDHGFSRILLEKPGATTPERMDALAQADTRDAISIAYNRRFLPSAMAARAIAAEDGGVQALSFEFTELAGRVMQAGHPPLVLANWALANSSHVIDLAFNLAGADEALSDVSIGATEVDRDHEWHEAGARFAGVGRIANRAMFTYLADWTSGGFWSVDLCTPERRLIMRPLEILDVRRRNETRIEAAELSVEPEGLKPGLHAMLGWFLNAEDFGTRLPTAREQAARVRVFQRMLGVTQSQAAHSGELVS